MVLGVEYCGVSSHTIGTWTIPCWWPVVAGLDSSEAQPWEVVLSHSRIVRWCRALTKKMAVCKVAICSLEKFESCIPPRGEKLLAGDLGGTSITSSVGKALAGIEKSGNSRPLPNE